MHRNCFSIIIVINFLLLINSVHGIEHNLNIQLFPKKQKIIVTDTFSITKMQDMSFYLNKNLTVVKTEPKINFSCKLIKKSERILKIFHAVPDKNIDKLRVTYTGTIYQEPKQKGYEYARSFKETSGIISTSGVYLSENSYWYPVFDDKIAKFKLTVKIPGNWKIISQGAMLFNKIKDDKCIISWDCKTPTDKIYLVGGPLISFEKKFGDIKAIVYLHEKNIVLAKKYLNATGRYINMYSDLIGKYPYDKFALVENFWDTGYGMPSFTLLGPKVIRFPFILYTSYPHEILHNWWGNGVFVDYKYGNWCEGLTAYLADHMMKELRNKGSNYRKEVLQKYHNFVKKEKDFPLIKFRERHSAATEAVGYGKSLMLFHELRQRIGDKSFIKGLKEFYKKFKFKYATFEDIEKTFSQVSNQNLKIFFKQRIAQTGAPKISIQNVRLSRAFKNTLLQFTIKQESPNGVYQLQLPIAITLEKTKKVVYKKIFFDKPTQHIALLLKSKPLRIDLDPEFDIFRRVYPSELAVSFGQIFGAKKRRIIISSKQHKNFQSLFKIWKDAVNTEISLDSDFVKIPKDRSLWVLGNSEIITKRLKNIFSLKNVRFEKEYVFIGKKKFSLTKDLIILTANHPYDKELAVGWILGNSSKIDRVIRKLPHYSKYSYLVFRDTQNIYKGQWPIFQSPMTYSLKGKLVPRGELPKRHALIKMPTLFSVKSLITHVNFLASKEMKGRGLGTLELDKAAKYIAAYFQKTGLRPGGENNSFFQTWTYNGKFQNRRFLLTNVIGILPGKNKKMNNPIVIGAHYDHLGTKRIFLKNKYVDVIYPGADDNASGVAVMLELAKYFSSSKNNSRSLVFIAFTGEESGCLGSKYYINRYLRNNTDKISGMINIDTVGRLENQNLKILGSNTAKEWYYIFHGCSMKTGVKVACVPKMSDSSDQVSFIEKGIPAVQIFSGAHLDYHTRYDTVQKIDFKGLLKVTKILKEVIEYLDNRKTSLIRNIKKGKVLKKIGHRKTKLGIIPDFAGTERGVLLKGVVKDSPAQKAGLKKGYILIGLGRFSINTLYDLAKALKFYEPGQKVVIVYIHNKIKKAGKIILGRK